MPPDDESDYPDPTGAAGAPEPACEPESHEPHHHVAELHGLLDRIGVPDLEPTAED